MYVLCYSETLVRIPNGEYSTYHNATNDTRVTLKGYQQNIVLVLQLVPVIDGVVLAVQRSYTVTRIFIKIYKTIGH